MSVPGLLGVAYRDEGGLLATISTEEGEVPVPSSARRPGRDLNHPVVTEVAFTP